MGERAYLLGHPVSHSKSPVMYRAAFEALGLDWTYELLDCSDGGDARALIEARDYLFLNITMPHKPLAFKCATHPTAAASLARGANLLVVEEGGLFADNTDGVGCTDYLQRRGCGFSGARVAVCGTGPTACAILHAAAAAGAARAALIGRDGSRAQARLDGYRAAASELAGEPSSAAGPFAQMALDEPLPPSEFAAFSYDAASDELARADLIVDATSLGMNESDPAPFDTALLSPRQTVFDVVYGHGETALVKAARALGCAVYDGEGMLVAQAVAVMRRVCAACGVSAGDADLFAVMARAAGFSALENV